MNSRNKRIVLVDYQIDANSEWLNTLKCQAQDIVILDPLNLFSELDWTRYEDDGRVIHTIYSQLFENVIMNKKRLVCFWPLDQQFGNEWFELETLCNNHDYGLESYKSSLFNDNNHGFSEEILRSWKKFVYFLIESLLVDTQRNEQFYEIATLTSGKETIILFKVEQEENIRYSFAFDSDFLGLAPNQIVDPLRMDCHLQSFGTFNEMLEKLLKENDLSLFESKFVDCSLEKAYFSILSKEFKTKNLIENWINTYSMN